MIKAVLNNQIIAQSEQTIQVEGSHYFPASDVDRGYLTASATRTTCPVKGTAHYFNVTVGTTTIEDAAWAYLEPLEGYQQIKGYTAFWRGIDVVG